MPQKSFKSRQQVCQRGSPKEDSSSYALLHSDEEGIDEDPITLLNINRPTSLRKIEIINIQVRPDDTLQALALRYRCTISELKRLNKIDKENEIYAKPYIKVPIQPFSILTETLTNSQESSTTETISVCEEKRFAEIEQHSIDLSFTAKAEPINTEINTIILNSVCKPLPLCNDTEVLYTENDRLLLEDNDVQSTNTQAINSNTNSTSCSTDDCGTYRPLLILLIFIIISFGPFIYVYLQHLTAQVKT